MKTTPAKAGLVGHSDDDRHKEGNITVRLLWLVIPVYSFHVQSVTSPSAVYDFLPRPLQLLTLITTQPGQTLLPGIPVSSNPAGCR